MSFCQRHNFQVDKVPLENGGWIGGRQNLWLIASLMWQGPAVWGNWSALRVDTFCVSLSCRLLLAWPWGPGAGQFTLQTLRGQHQLFYCGYWLVQAAPLWLICLLTSAWSGPASILSLSTPSSPHSVSSDTYFKPSFYAQLLVPLWSNTQGLFIKQLLLKLSFNQYSSPPPAAWN